MSTSIRTKLAEIQQRLNAPKNNHNKFGNYSYRSCEDILEAVKPLLQETNTALTVNDDLVNIGERYYVKATAVLHDCESEAMIANTAFAREEETKKGMDASQITGSASSYARKYALNGLFCIDDVRDADTRDNRSDIKKTISDSDAVMLEADCLAMKVNVDALKTKLNVKTFKELTPQQAEWIRAKIKEAQA